eukprot:TRINITY_DN17371_c0_g1_i1.p1 TRINITY_DN17371_c0_g1~~TRINITY_DN17371_c0_g1_i1.p1  ORF type:complete len:1219 (+),score=186.53 TRINITY_DN17371_c0_g1_i1:173-3829(+)
MNSAAQKAAPSPRGGSAVAVSSYSMGDAGGSPRTTLPIAASAAAPSFGKLAVLGRSVSPPLVRTASIVRAASPPHPAATSPRSSVGQVQQRVVPLLAHASSTTPAHSASSHHRTAVQAECVPPSTHPLDAGVHAASAQAASALRFVHQASSQPVTSSSRRGANGSDGGVCRGKPNASMFMKMKAVTAAVRSVHKSKAADTPFVQVTMQSKLPAAAAPGNMTAESSFLAKSSSSMRHAAVKPPSHTQQPCGLRLPLHTAASEGPAGARSVSPTGSGTVSPVYIGYPLPSSQRRLPSPRTGIACSYAHSASTATVDGCRSPSANGMTSPSHVSLRSTCPSTCATMSTVSTTTSTVAGSIKDGHATPLSSAGDRKHGLRQRAIVVPPLQLAGATSASIVAGSADSGRATTHVPRGRSPTSSVSLHGVASSSSSPRFFQASSPASGHTRCPSPALGLQAPSSVSGKLSPRLAGSQFLPAAQSSPRFFLGQGGIGISGRVNCAASSPNLQSPRSLSQEVQPIRETPAASDPRGGGARAAPVAVVHNVPARSSPPTGLPLQPLPDDRISQKAPRSMALEQQPADALQQSRFLMVAPTAQPSDVLEDALAAQHGVIAAGLDCSEAGSVDCGVGEPIPLVALDSPPGCFRDSDADADLCCTTSFMITEEKEVLEHILAEEERTDYRDGIGDRQRQDEEETVGEWRAKHTVRMPSKSEAAADAGQVLSEASPEDPEAIIKSSIEAFTLWCTTLDELPVYENLQGDAKDMLQRLSALVGALSGSEPEAVAPQLWQRIAARLDAEEGGRKRGPPAESAGILLDKAESTSTTAPRSDSHSAVSETVATSSLGRQHSSGNDLQQQVTLLSEPGSVASSSRWVPPASSGAESSGSLQPCGLTRSALPVHSILGPGPLAKLGQYAARVQAPPEVGEDTQLPLEIEDEQKLYTSEKTRCEDVELADGLCELSVSSCDGSSLQLGSLQLGSLQLGEAFEAFTSSAAVAAPTAEATRAVEDAADEDAPMDASSAAGPFQDDASCVRRHDSADFLSWAPPLVVESTGASSPHADMAGKLSEPATEADTLTSCSAGRTPPRSLPSSLDLSEPEARCDQEVWDAAADGRVEQASLTEEVAHSAAESQEQQCASDESHCGSTPESEDPEDLSSAAASADMASGEHSGSDSLDVLAAGVDAGGQLPEDSREVRVSSDAGNSDLFEDDDLPFFGEMGFGWIF